MCVKLMSLTVLGPQVLNPKNVFRKFKKPRKSINHFIFILSFCPSSTSNLELIIIGCYLYGDLIKCTLLYMRTIL